MFRAVRSYTIFEWNETVLNVPGRTVDLRLLGSSTIMTDNVENIRAIMSTKVRREELSEILWVVLMLR